MSLSSQVSNSANIPSIIGKDLTLNGILNIVNQVNTSVPLSVTGATGQTGKLFTLKNVSGTTVFSVSVEGNVEYLGTESITDSLNVTGNGVVGGTLNVGGVITAAVGISVSSGGVNVIGESTFQNKVTVNSLYSQGDVFVQSGYIRSNYGADLYLYPSSGGITVIGGANTTSHSLTAQNDLFVGGKLEVDGATYFDGGMALGDDDYLYFGDSSDAGIAWNTSQTVDGLFLGLSDGQNTFVIAENGDKAFDFAHGAQTNPTVFVHSASQSTTQWLSLTHNATDAVITTGLGDLLLNLAGGNLAPTTNGGSSLGISGGNTFANLYLASGGSIDWGGGDVIIANAANTISIGGALIHNINQASGTTGLPVALTVTGGTHTGLTAATEAIGVNFNFSATKTWAAGAGPLATQREILIQAPTYAGNVGGALTITDAYTLYVNGGPTQGANMTLTRSWAAGFLGNVGFAAGTEALPSIAFNLDPDTGIYNGAANTLNLGTAGSSRISISATASSFSVPVWSSDTTTLTLAGRIADGATAVGVIIDNRTALTVAGAKIASFQNAEVEKASIGYDGVVYAVGGFQIPSSATYGGSALVDVVREYGTANGLRLRGQMADGAAAYGVKIGATTALTTAGAKIAAFFSDSFTTERAYIDYLGGLTVSQGISTTGVAVAGLTIAGGAHTGLTAATEAIGVNFNLVATKTWLAGAGPLATQREILIQAPTYAGNVGTPLTITNAYTFSVSGAPLVGLGIILTKSWAAGFGGAVQITYAGTAYVNSTGLLDISRTGNLTGVDATSIVDLNLAPVFTLTEPAGGQNVNYFGANIDVSGISVTAGAGTSTLAALRLVANSDADAAINYALFVDYGTSRLEGQVQIGDFGALAIIPDANYALHIATSVAGGGIRLTGTDAGASGIALTGQNKSASPADGDILFTINFNGDDGAINDTTYGSIYTEIQDAINGSEESIMRFSVLQGAGALIEYLRLDGTDNILSIVASQKIDATAQSIRIKRSVADVSNPPTDAELDAAFGDPTVVGSGFLGIIDDADGGTNSYVCWTTGTAGEWFYGTGTKAL